MASHSLRHKTENILSERVRCFRLLCFPCWIPLLITLGVTISHCCHYYRNGSLTTLTHLQISWSFCSISIIVIPFRDHWQNYVAVYDIPIFNNVSRRVWTDQYLSHNFRNMRYHVEKSSTNRFMYWTTTAKKSIIGQKYNLYTHTRPRILCRIKLILIRGIIWRNALMQLNYPHPVPIITLWQPTSVVIVYEILLVVTWWYFEVIRRTCLFLLLSITKVYNVGLEWEVLLRKYITMADAIVLLFSVVANGKFYHHRSHVDTYIRNLW